MNTTPAPVPSASSTISSQLVVVVGLLAVLFMIAFVYCAVVIMSVILRTSAQRDNARQVLGEVGSTLEHLVEKLVDLVRGRAQQQGIPGDGKSPAHETDDCEGR